MRTNERTKQLQAINQAIMSATSCGLAASVAASVAKAATAYASKAHRLALRTMLRESLSRIGVRRTGPWANALNRKGTTARKWSHAIEQQRDAAAAADAAQQMQQTRAHGKRVVTRPTRYSEENDWVPGANNGSTAGRHIDPGHSTSEVTYGEKRRRLR